MGLKREYLLHFSGIQCIVELKHITNKGRVDQFDYIVVGAKSAVGESGAQGAASRGRGRDSSPWLHIPVGYFKTMHNPAFDWCYLTEPYPSAGRRLQWTRGKVLGGSSALNGLLYVRGMKTSPGGIFKAMTNCSTQRAATARPFLTRLVPARWATMMRR